MSKTAIIGGGNLGSAIAKGLVYTKSSKPTDIHVTRRRAQMLDSLSNMGIITGSDNIKAVDNADIVFLAVKPFQIEDVIKQISSSVKKDAAIISLAAGVETKTLIEVSGLKNPVFRAMPNTAVAIGQSMTCICSGNASEKQLKHIESWFEKLGSVLIIPEELMAGATVLAACGIAFAMRFIRASTQGGIEIGFSSDLALKIASQTVKGAAHLLISEEAHPEAEIDKVTTPRGITISGLNEMEYNGFSSSLIKGLLTSYKKIEQK